jgi:hypothetical protein
VDRQSNAVVKENLINSLNLFSTGDVSTDGRCVLFGDGRVPWVKGHAAMANDGIANAFATHVPVILVNEFLTSQVR